MKIQILLETFEQMFASLEELGIQKEVDKAKYGHIFKYKFRDEDVSEDGVDYMVEIAVGTVYEYIGEYIDPELMEDDKDVLENTSYAYIDLSANQRTQATGLWNTTFVYNRLIASIIDTVKSQNARLVAFMPASSKMAVAYISIAKKLLNRIDGFNFEGLNSSTYVDESFMDMLTPELRKLIDTSFRSDIKAEAKNFKDTINKQRKFATVGRTLRSLIGKKCIVGSKTGTLLKFKVDETLRFITITLSGDGGQNQITNILPGEVAEIKVVQ